MIRRLTGNSAIPIVLSETGKSSRCIAPWIGVQVTADGKVVPCCHDYDETYVLGDLNKGLVKILQIYHGTRGVFGYTIECNVYWH